MPETVKFRLCVLTYRCLNGTAPHYLAETIHPVRAVAPDSIYDLPTRQLYLCHPHAAQLLAIAHFRRLPHEHGTLPQLVQDAPSLPVFRRELDCAVPVVLSG